MTFEAVHCASYTLHTRSFGRRLAPVITQIQVHNLFGLCTLYSAFTPQFVCLTFATELECVYIHYKGLHKDTNY